MGSVCNWVMTLEANLQLRTDVTGNQVAKLAFHNAVIRVAELLVKMGTKEGIFLVRFILWLLGTSLGTLLCGSSLSLRREFSFINKFSEMTVDKREAVLKRWSKEKSFVFLRLWCFYVQVNAALIEALKKGTSFGAPCFLENVLAEMVISAVPSVEMVRFVNSGTEACMGALRLARAFKFEGCYHGHADAFLVKAGSGVATLGLPDSPGVVPKAATSETLTAPYNDLEAVKNLLFEAHKGEIAAVILEPVVGNAGFIVPKPGFLSTLRQISEEDGALLIFDEVMTGFRLSYGGAQEYFGITPDLTTMGKVIGGGLPVGAYGGRKDIMQMVAPAGPLGIKGGKSLLRF
ncbi:LOW QUALITY PROTEIN: glutamate-1-semialdehyde 2,1-aminomutase, chloroplastic-like [Asparagus officinalis]|uniref:LOW QUALITY PROTEIN: glutamate-1-semialdehyde 2,1-aminomutase, chloroplastic-like n=1 Tax=Asparagus officinalis TaxID=4686 RepID=UPI00098E2334|nr:LOW QUALITY PROTEIN: glutamate-1-semialdehyde 2,1-aminomutase, chloroplastic-like [Asparagus officinalis]